MKPKSTLGNFLALAGSSLLAMSSAHAVDGTWNTVNNGNWSTSSNWLGSPDPVPGGVGSIISIESNITGARDVTIDTTSRTVGSLTIGDASHGFTIRATGGASLIFDNGLSDATLTENFTTGLADFITAPITLNSNLALTTNGSLTVSGEISGLSKSITKSGAGTLILTGNNSYSGGFTLDAGTVQVASTNNAVVDPYTGFGTGTLTINGGTIRTASAGSFTTANDSIWNANFTLNRGITGTATWNHQGDVTLNANIAHTLSASFFVLNVSGDIGETGGARSLTINQGGFTMTLSGDNTYSGGTTISAGRLNLGSATALGSGPLAINGGTIDNTSGNNALSVANWTIGGSFTFGGTNDLTLTGNFSNNTNNRSLTLQGTNSTLTLDGSYTNSQSNSQNYTVNGAGNTLVVTGGWNLSHNGTGRLLQLIGTGDVLVIGAMVDSTVASSASNLRKGNNASSTGTLTLAANNTFTGTTEVWGGTLRLGNGGTTGALLGTSSIDITNASAKLTINRSNAFTQETDLNNKALTGLGSFTQAGAGTTTLTLANTYQGGTTVTAGTLLVNNTTDSGTGTGDVTVANGGTLGGSGIISGATSIDGNLRPGTSPGVLSFTNSLALTATSTTTFEIDGTNRGSQYDGVNVGTTLVLDGALVFDLGTTLLSNATFNLFDVTGGTSGDFVTVSLAGDMGAGSFDFDESDVWSLNQGGNTWTFTQSTGDLSFAVIPEPSSALLGGLGLLALLRRRR
jgi:fibronectin-binding autotransporter adhesin